MSKGLERLARGGIYLGTLLAAAVLPLASAQDKLPALPSAKLDLATCLQAGLDRQPALEAARASLAAAEDARRGLDRMVLGRFMAPDLKIRKQQACFGVQIAQAGLLQAEWEARYAITRNYYSVIYARMQDQVVQGLVGKLNNAAKTAKNLVDKGDPKIPVTQLDVNNLIINRDFYRARGFEASVGIEKAVAALREAIGFKHNTPLDIIDDNLPALVDNLNKDELIGQALALRGEMAQVISANRITELEIDAQGKIRTPSARTFAMGSDPHAKPVPQGFANTDYRPGAIGLEMPPSMAGHRRERIERARDLNDRAVAVVDKTENLIALEVEAAYLKWREAASRARVLAPLPALAQKNALVVQSRFDNGNVSGEELIRARTQEDQARANYNDALYFHALALAALERVTAGAFRFPVSGP